MDINIKNISEQDISIYLSQTFSIPKAEQVPREELLT